MSDPGGHGTIAKRRAQTQRVPDKVRQAKGRKVSVVRAIPSRRAPVAALIGGDHVIARRRERAHDFPPAVSEFRKSMEQQDEGPPLHLESRLKYVDRETVDVMDSAGADADWQRGIAVRRKAVPVQANDVFAVGDRGTVNRLGRGSQSTLLQKGRCKASFTLLSNRLRRTPYLAQFSFHSHLPIKPNRHGQDMTPPPICAGGGGVGL